MKVFKNVTDLGDLKEALREAFEIKAEDVTSNIFALIDATIDFVLYFFYVKFAKQVLVAFFTNSSLK